MGSKAFKLSSRMDIRNGCILHPGIALLRACSDSEPTRALCEKKRLGAYAVHGSTLFSMSS